MKKGKWSLAVLIVSTMIIVSACGGNNSNNTNNSVNEGNVNTPAQQEGPIDPLGKYETPIEMTMAVSRSAEDFVTGESDGDNRWIDEYREALGIEVDVIWAAPQGSQYNERVGVTIATGDLPDVMMVDKVTLAQLVESDLVEDLTEVYEQYATPLMKEAINLDGNGYAEAQATFDGKLMAIPHTYPNLAGMLINIRKDWLDAVGLDAPETMEELLEISRAFTHDDPDGNGKDDTYGLAAGAEMDTWNLDLKGFFNGYGGYIKTWVKDENGDLVYGSTLPEVREALLQLQKMYADGQLDPEFAVKDVGKVGESFAADKLGMGYVAHFGPIMPFQDVKKLHPDLEVVQVPLVGLEGPAKPQANINIDRFFVVRKGYEHPEAAVKMGNLYLDIWQGEQAHRYSEMITGEANGEMKNFFQYAPLKIAHNGKNVAMVDRIVAAMDGSLDPKELNHEEASYYELIDAYEKGTGDASGWAYRGVYGPDGALSIQIDYANNQMHQINEFYGLPTETMKIRWSTLQNMEAEVFPKIIMGEPIEAFDKFVEDWNNLGGKDITAEVNEWYDANK